MTTFTEIYEEWMLPIINDYKIENLYATNKVAVFNYLKNFLINGLSDFDCIKPLTYHTEEVEDEETFQSYEDCVFDYDLDSDEKKIISKIAVANYFKRQIQDVRTRMPYMNQREFKKDALAPIMKQNDTWYNNLVSEYMEDIANYNMKHLDSLPYWEDI